MPKQMRENQRSFTIVAATGIASGREFGRYLGDEPKEAARKAIRQVFRMQRNPPRRVAVCLRETTRNSRRSPKRTPLKTPHSPDGSKLFFYEGTREPIPPNDAAREMFKAQFRYRIVSISEEEFAARR